MQSYSLADLPQLFSPIIDFQPYIIVIDIGGNDLASPLTDVHASCIVLSAFLHFLSQVLHLPGVYAL